jgi:hypothetical protein
MAIISKKKNSNQTRSKKKLSQKRFAIFSLSFLMFTECPSFTSRLLNCIKKCENIIKQKLNKSLE